MEKQAKIVVQETAIRLLAIKEDDFFSITDIARRFNTDSPADIIANWMRNKDTVEFLGTWEVINNPDFKLLEFEEFRTEAGANRFVLSPTKWAAVTNAIGLRTKAGRHGGGTFAHKDIALAFCYWLSPTFQLYVIKEFQRLKERESAQLQLQWDLRRELAKANFHIHADAVRENLVPMLDWNTKQEAIQQASEADLLNLALFGITAREWKLHAPPDRKGNMRDHASVEQLLVLANLESLNAEFIRLGYGRDQRIRLLHKAAQTQMEVLAGLPSVENIKKSAIGQNHAQLPSPAGPKPAE